MLRDGFIVVFVTPPFFFLLFSRVVKSECIAGEQNVHYLAPKYCLMADDVPVTKKVPCSTEIPFVVQVNTEKFA